ncbi:hypothetical protein AK88_01600 [Plasmodium fragile]|uniref:CPW-WPC domain-containing protein n=1 Tax=Plasmodium fragile TaxID=5857 RepID=A0A0D9QNU8_PLAFR|nr:uncharacterized protein AK88_01600 [Plasmodium fragile]KJP88719.1 hypothetical protein AK88_01600 [Plasmodium fragile]
MAPCKLFTTVLLLAVLGARPPSVFPPFGDATRTGEGTLVGELNVGGETGQFDDLSRFSRELLEPLSRFLKSVPAAALREKVKTQVTKAAESLDLPNPDEEACEINYAELCPAGWGDWGNGDNCISPVTYHGPCKNKMVSFVNSTPTEKYKFCIKCDVSWPCLHRCGEEDLLEECPEGWTLEGKICHAPKSYIGKCVRKKIFTNFSREEKKAWADACDIRWPCKKKNYNFDELCPHNWMPTPDNKHCSANSSYVGPCGSILYLYNLKEEEKRFLMNKCNVEWPVRGSEEESKGNDFVCPLGWRIHTSHNKGGGTTCSPPNSYNGPCTQSEEIKNISFEHMSKEEKYELSRRCDFMWPSTFDRYQNFELACPYNWVLVDAVEHICAAPVEYTEPCNNISSFKGYTHEMKAAWAARCKAPFVNEATFQMGRKYKKGKKIFGLNRDVNSSNILLAHAPWLRDGPIGSATSNYHRGDRSSATNRQFLPNHDESLMRRSGGALLPLTERSNEDPPHEFILSDKKITELLLLKQASTDHELRRSIDEVVQMLRRGYSPRGANAFSFLQVRSKQPHSSRSTKASHKQLDMASSIVETAETQLGQNDTYEESPPHGSDAPLRAEIQHLSEMKNLYKNYQLDKADQSYYEHMCLEKNYSECPVGWTKLSAKQCMAPSWYRTNVHKCSSMINLNDLTRSLYDVAHDMSFISFDEEKIKKLEKKCGLEFPCKDCERDYVQVSCPLGWTETNDEWCEAPADYPPHLKEICGTNVNFKYATPLIRRNWSLLCRSDWPCFSPCEKNYGAVCPVGYELINERLDAVGGGTIHVCVNRSWAPSRVEDAHIEAGRVHAAHVEVGQVEDNWTNACLVIEVYNSVEIKKQIERKCRIIWPCLEKCVQDYHQTCPYNWLLKENNCIAPYHYSPPQGCSKSFAVRSFSSFNKYLFSNKCFAPWPCINACQQDWSQPCPAHWALVTRRNGKSVVDQKTASSSSHFCKPLKRYMHRGVCTDEYYDLTTFTFLQKQEFSHRCGVRWPCGSSSSQLYSPNWQSEKVYKDVGFQRLRTLRFYDTHYASRYAKLGSSFF